MKAAAAAATTSSPGNDNAKRHRTDIDPTVTSLDISSSAAGAINHHRPTKRYQSLLCGLRAVNAIFHLHGKPPIERSQMDEVNMGIAKCEASLSNDLVAACTHLQTEGNYALDVIASALHLYGSMSLAKATLQPDGTPVPGIYLLGDGHHWQVLYSRPEGKWARCDGPAFPISCCADFVGRYVEQGVLLHVMAAEPAAPFVRALRSAGIDEVTAQRSGVISTDATASNHGGQPSHSDVAIADFGGNTSSLSIGLQHDACIFLPGEVKDSRESQPRDKFTGKHGTVADAPLFPQRLYQYFRSTSVFLGLDFRVSLIQATCNILCSSR